jgi:rSAM/selenodomain-associated transferase 1
MPPCPSVLDETCRRSAGGDVILLAKEPRPGLAKTRLAAEIGAEAAIRLARAFLSDTAAWIGRYARRVHIAYAPDDAYRTFAALLPDACLFPQPDGDLGQRIAGAFECAFALGARKPLLVGSDSPTMPSHFILCAHAALDRHDMVLGPSEDGGFYAIGLRRPLPGLFDGVEWSTERVLRQVKRNAGRHGYSAFYLPYWYDVDTAPDLQRLTKDPLLGASTARVLRDLDAGRPGRWDGDRTSGSNRHWSGDA